MYNFKSWEKDIPIIPPTGDFLSRDRVLTYFQMTDVIMPVNRGRLIHLNMEVGGLTVWLGKEQKTNSVDLN